MMRLEAAGAQLRILYFGGIFLSTGAGALHQYGYGRYAGPFVAVIAAGTLAFAWTYTELGIWNQKNRDAMDRGSDFSGPNMYMDDKLIGAAVYAAFHGEPPDDDALESIETAVAKPWLEFRDGMNPADIERRHAQLARKNGGVDADD